jgi:hypothetical protein
MTDYMMKMKKGGPESVRPLLREGMQEACRDMQELVNKWRIDMPLLLAAVTLTKPLIEAWCGADGRSIANEICRMAEVVGTNIIENTKEGT